MNAQQVIEDHRQHLLDKGLDVGEPDGPAQALGYKGGYVRHFRRASIYWHPSTGAHEVHGTIRQLYQHDGGPGPRLGYPVSDELSSKDGQAAFSLFTNGTILARRDSHGPTEVNGEIFKVWRLEWGIDGFEFGRLGMPLVSLQVARGTAVYFERGLLWRGDLGNPVGVQVVKGTLVLPLIGQPHVASPKGMSLRSAVRWGIGDAALAAMKANKPDLFAKLWSGRLAVRAVSISSADMPLSHRRRTDRESDLVVRGDLQDRALYDILLTARAFGAMPQTDLAYGPLAEEPHLPDWSTETEPGLHEPASGGQPSPALDAPVPTAVSTVAVPARVVGMFKRRWVLAPHAIYAKSTWSDFGLVHASDTHISRRSETFKQRLRSLGRVAQSRVVINVNDEFRKLVTRCNELHAAGDLDALIVTGDLVDYVYEDDDNRGAGGNFRYLSRLILGKQPSPEGVRSDELHVPVFLVPGNHDYRPNPYGLLVELTALGYGFKQVRAYLSHNMNWDDALALQGDHKPRLNPDQAAKMVAIDKDLAYYRQHLSRSESYVVALGTHRLVMLDSGWDIGVLDSILDGAKLFTGFATEDERTFASGSPNCRGFTSLHLSLIRRALKEAGATGLVMVGVHAPPLNLTGPEHPHYFRETEHLDADDAEIDGYLERRLEGRVLRQDKRQTIAALRGRWPTGTPYFKDGHITGRFEFLDHGVSKGKNKEFLGLCVGKSGRPIDLVLAGHTHHDTEFRLTSSGSGFKVHTDFYTENPSEYYPSRRVKLDHGDYPDNLTRVVVAGTTSGGTTTRTEYGPHGSFPRATVPPNQNTMEGSGNSGPNWLKQHRPLIVQTAAVGLTESNSRGAQRFVPPTFRGARLVAVRNDQVVSISRIAL